MSHTTFCIAHQEYIYYPVLFHRQELSSVYFPHSSIHIPDVSGNSGSYFLRTFWCKLMRCSIEDQKNQYPVYPIMRWIHRNDVFTCFFIINKPFCIQTKWGIILLIKLFESPFFSLFGKRYFHILRFCSFSFRCKYIIR